MSFWDYGLADDIVHGVQAMGFTEPTDIQRQAFPVVLGGRDLIASAPTGTGKTAAFCLPVLSLLGGPGKQRVLILEPTRELAAQVGEALTDYSQFLGTRNVVIHGGVAYGPQKDALKRGVDVVVATPGRLLDHIGEKAISLQDTDILILDEMDRMLDMGFMPDVRKIIEFCPRKRQTLLFSATTPPEVEILTHWVLKDPATVEIGARRSVAETVKHAFYPVAIGQKFDLLRALLEETEYESVLVFVRTRRNADMIANQLQKENHSVATLHSDRTQAQRTEALNGYKNGDYEVLVATDIASRGIDIEGISHVINYDIPQNPEDYVHRIGRTGRAKSEGDAFTLVTAEDLDEIAAIESFINKKVPSTKLDGFEYTYTQLLDEDLSELKARSRGRGSRRPAKRRGR